MNNREEIMQADCFKWHWNTYPDQRRMLYHVNNNAQNAIKGALLKAKGVVKGVSDFTLIVSCHVHFIELKLPGETQSDEQIDFMNKVTAKGHLYFIVYSLVEFQNLVKKLYGQY